MINKFFSANICLPVWKWNLDIFHSTFLTIFKFRAIRCKSRNFISYLINFSPLFTLSLPNPFPWPLLTLDPKVEIIGSPDMHVDTGSTINLTCVIAHSPEPPSYIFWYHNGQVSTLDCCVLSWNRFWSCSLLGLCGDAFNLPLVSCDYCDKNMKMSN